MLIIVGGFPGSGIRFLARETAHRSQYYYYEINDRKIRAPISTDEQLTALYRRVLGDFRLAAKMYSTVVVADQFDRAAPRDLFLREAKKYFDRVHFVWVECGESDAQQRFEARKRTYAEWSKKRRAKSKSQFQPFGHDVPVFSYTGPVEDITEDFRTYVRSITSAT